LKLGAGQSRLLLGKRLFGEFPERTEVSGGYVAALYLHRLEGAGLGEALTLPVACLCASVVVVSDAKISWLENFPMKRLSHFLKLWLPAGTPPAWKRTLPNYDYRRSYPIANAVDNIFFRFSKRISYRVVQTHCYSGDASGQR
jgi:hypothetical protein